MAGAIAKEGFAFGKFLMPQVVKQLQLLQVSSSGFLGALVGGLSQARFRFLLSRNTLKVLVH